MDSKNGLQRQVSVVEQTQSRKVPQTLSIFLAPITMGNHRVSLLFVLIGLVAVINAGDMMRKSIVFDKNTPDVFYCPQHKPTGFEKMIVRAKPLSKLCQFEGGPIPEDYKSDCYNDVDETEYACKEKYRIMKRFSKADDEGAAIDNDYIEK